jgi:hypothetical protein
MSVVQIIIDCGNGAAVRIQSRCGTKGLILLSGFYLLLVSAFLPLGVCKYLHVARTWKVCGASNVGFWQACCSGTGAEEVVEIIIIIIM